MNTEFNIKDLIKDLSQLKEDTGLCLKKNASKYNYLQNYFYFMHYPLFTYTESILILCDYRKYGPAGVLLRSLVEAHINIIYHQLEDSQNRLAISAKEGFHEKLKVVKELQDLIRKYPNLTSKEKDGLLNKENLTKKELWVQGHIAAIVKGNNIRNKDRDLDLKSKAIKCDQGHPSSEKGHFERMYSVIYRFLSPYSHLNTEGLDRFVEKNISGEFTFNEGRNHELFMIEATGICIAFVKDLYEHKIIDTLPSSVKDIEDKLILSAQNLKPKQLSQ